MFLCLVLAHSQGHRDKSVLHRFYVFCHNVKADGTRLDLAVKQGNNRVDAILPEGNHTIFATISDSQDSSTEFSFVVEVYEADLSGDFSNFAQAQSGRLLDLAAKGDQNAFMQTLVSASSTLGPPNNTASGLNAGIIPCQLSARFMENFHILMISLLNLVRQGSRCV